MGRRLLTEITNRPRQFGYLLATLILATASHRDPYLYAWMILLLAYPPLMSRVLDRLPSVKSARFSMLVDGLMVGLLISLVGFNFELSVVFISLLVISALIIGGITCLFPVLPMLGLGALVGSLLHPASFVGGESSYFVSFISLIAYVVFIGLMVFDETKQLKVERQLAKTASTELENFRRWVEPFVPVQLRSAQARSGGQRRKRLTVFFSDISGFTALMDSTDEGQVAELLNDYFTEMTTVAHRFGGTVDKFIGDGIMIFFGDPSSRGSAQDALTCVAMALEMRDRFQCLSDRWQSLTGSAPLHLRIGIHSGYCLVGDFGSSERRDYTALGSTVNLASRLERRAEPDEILVSGEIIRLAGARLSGIPRGELELRGFTRPVPAYSVTGLSAETGAAG